MLIEESYWDSSSEAWSLGAFIQPVNGVTLAEPRICTDYSISAPRLNLMLRIYYLNGFWNTGTAIYLEDYYGGDFFMEIILHYYDVTTTVQRTSISAIKSLY